jgi:hypothetical protein
MANSSTKQLIRLLLLLISTLTMNACSEPSRESVIKIETVTLDNGNISSFKQEILQDYIFD